MEKYKTAPQLIPIYSHRYISYIPDGENIPIFSIAQSDIIYYGRNLIFYFEDEFDIKEHGDNECQYIKFWSNLL